MVYAQTPGGVSGFTLDLWIDGNNSTATTWPNLAPAAFSLEGGVHRPAVRNSRFNFHQELFFGNQRNAKMRTTANYILQPGRAFYAFVVTERDGAGTEQVLLSYNPTTSAGNARRTSLQWDGSNIRVGWAGTMHNLVNTQRHGIASMNVVNGGASTVYMNGAFANFTAASQTVTASPLFIGSGSNNMTSTAAAGDNLNFTGAIQEVIVMSGATRMSDNDIQRIHSYLAIKYGLTLNNNLNILDSDASTVWNRTANAGFNNHIFGIARDDATRLNQVQSRHTDSPILTLFRGSRIETLNSSNTAPAFAADRTYLMLGSNNQSLNVNVSYMHMEGTSFANMPTIDFKFNFRTALIYRAQVTAGGVASSETTNMRIEGNPRLNFVLVSSDPNFSPAATRIYPISNGIATGVLIHSGDYISFGGFEPTPGGVSGYILGLWVDGNSSTNTAWYNRASATHTLERFSTHAPIVRNSRFNFHRELFFGNQTSAKLRTSAPFQLTRAESYYIFVVSESPNATGTLLTFGNAAANSSLRWMAGTGTGSVLNANWTTTERSANRPANAVPRFGIAALNVNNANSSAGNQILLNGVGSTFSLGTTAAAGGAQHTTNHLLIGNASAAAGTGSTVPFNGAIQEIIVMRRTANAIMPPNDIQRIKTYLAIKYGIHLEAGNYLASDETVVWDRTANAGFNNHIFGIGRDDFSGLHQMQAQSASARYLTVFVGDRLAALNSENTGTMEDGQYLMIGSDGRSAITQLPVYIAVGTQFQNDTIAASEALNIQSPVFKAQLTGMTEIVVNTMPMRDFLYALVSTDGSFNPLNTRIYPVVGGVAEIRLTSDYRYFKYVGFSPGPGGVTAGLNMWLDAANAFSLGIENLPLTDATLGGFNQPVSDAENVPTVIRWGDLARGHNYVITNTQRRPVFEYHNPEMNFQPSVRFWNTANTVFLGNSNPVMNTINTAHTVIFVTNNNFGTRGRANMLMFSGPNLGSYNAPGFSIERAGGGEGAQGRGMGRYRFGSSAGNATTGNQLMFDIGSTLIAGFFVTPNGSSGGTVRYRFNAWQETDTWTGSNSINFTRGSTLGIGDRASLAMNGLLSEVIIFDRILTAEETARVESYLAFKYGITLRPFETATQRANYTLSDGNIVWQGNIADLNNSFVRFYNNIAGVVRDDFARINLGQSHSTDLGSILHMGVPDPTSSVTRLTDCGSYLSHLSNDLEAIIWGSNTASGFSPSQEEECGDFDYRFNRIWFVHKHTQPDQDGNSRPLQMLISPRNNQGTTFGAGSDWGTQQYYNVLHGGNNLFLIIGDSPEDIENGIYRRVVPLAFIEGQHQGIFTFTERYTYITFAYRVNAAGCFGSPDSEFQGTKRFDWTQWTSRTNPNRNTVIPVNITVPGGAFGDLGDGIQVLSTSISYPSGAFSASGTGVRAYRGFPRSANLPERGSLEVQRRGGQPSGASDVIIRIVFNEPVMPEFTIAGLSSDRRAMEEVEIVGWCGGVNDANPIRFSPRLSHVGLPTQATYTIRGNRATVNRTRLSANASNRNGQVRVEFQGGVQVVEIRYRITGRRSTARQQIWISPLVLRSVPPPVTINEDGLGFAIQVRETNLYTCDPVEYTFFIHNTNCDPKYITFTDTLQSEYMYWIPQSLGLDTTNALDNPSIVINEYDGTRIIVIDSLLLEPSSVTRLSLAAAFRHNAPGGTYENRASISYYRAGGTIVNPIFTRETLEASVVVNVTQMDPMDSVIIEARSVQPSYSPNSIVEAVLTLTNPNLEDIEDSFLDIDFNEEFTFIPGSVRITDAADNDITSEFRIIVPAADEEYLNFFSIVGLCHWGDAMSPPPGCTENDPEGFALQNGQIFVRFQLQAPAEPEEELDIDDNPTGRKVPLEINFNFSSGMIIPCGHSVLPDGGTLIVPHTLITHIRTNRDRTIRFWRRRN